MAPDDYCCRVCHGSMHVPDGLDPLDEDVRFCSECAINEIERLRGQGGWVVQLESGCWLAPWGGDPGRTCDIKSAHRFDTKALAEEALVQARMYREFSEAFVFEMDKEIAILQFKIKKLQDAIDWLEVERTIREAYIKNLERRCGDV